MITCEHMTKKYGRKTVVEDLSFDVKKGEVFALLGANGAGKTTTIKILLGLAAATSGRAEVDDGLSIGFSPESPYFPSFLTGREVLRYYGKLSGLSNKKLNAVIPQLLSEVGLEDDKVTVKYYSKGMLQRLSLAQSLLGEPQLLVLDEPTSGLDALGRLEVLNLISRMKAKDITVVFNSHILDDIERVCDRGIILKKGRLVSEWEKGITAPDKTLEQYFIESLQEEE